MKNFWISFFITLISLPSFTQSAQDKAKMENERQAIQKELKEIQSVYNQVKGKKKEGQSPLLITETAMLFDRRRRNFFLYY